MVTYLLAGSVKYSRYCAGLLSLVIIGLLIQTLFQLGGMIHQGGKMSPREIAVQRLSPPSQASDLNDDLSPLIERNIFGREAEQTQVDNRSAFQVQANLPSDDFLLKAPVSGISARLVGVLSSPQSARGLAIVEQSGVQQTYAPGEKLAGQFVVIRVFADRIVINENGHYAALLMD